MKIVVSTDKTLAQSTEQNLRTIFFKLLVLAQRLVSPLPLSPIHTIHSVSPLLQTCPIKDMEGVNS